MFDYCKTYYEQPDLWGKCLTDAEKERVSVTLSLIPDDVQTVLDVGCGDGRITNQMKDYIVTAVDTSLEAIKYIKTRKALASVECIPFKDRSFDLVLSSEVIEHLTDSILRKAVEEIQRVSMNYILVSVPFKENLYAESTRCNNCRKLFHIYQHFQSFSRRRLANLFPNFKPIGYSTFGPESEYNNNLILFIVRRLGKKWPVTKTALCPRCGSTNVGSDKGNTFSWFAERVGWRLAKIYPYIKKAWIVVLYQRIENDKTAFHT